MEQECRTSLREFLNGLREVTVGDAKDTTALVQSILNVIADVFRVNLPEVFDFVAVERDDRSQQTKANAASWIGGEPPWAAWKVGVIFFPLFVIRTHTSGGATVFGREFP
jgi:hypothetical protein